MNEINFTPLHTLNKACLLCGLMGAPAYLMGVHLLHRMESAGTEVLCLRLEDLLGVRVHHKTTGELLAGDLATTFYCAGQSGPSALYDTRATLIPALQELHDLRIVMTDIEEPRLSRQCASEPMSDYHFSRDPSLSFGRHWSSGTPIFYRAVDWSEGGLADALEGMGAGPARAV